MDNSNNTSGQVFPQQPQLPQMEPPTPPQMTPPMQGQTDGFTAPNGAPGKKALPVIIIAAIVAIVVVGAAIAIIIMANGKSTGDKQKQPEVAKQEPVETEIGQDSEEYSYIDIERNNTLMRLVAAVESYQMDNNDGLPFGDGKKIGEDLVQLYIDTTCVSTVDNGDEVRYSSCSEEFSDFSDNGAFSVYYKGVADDKSFDNEGKVDVSDEIKEEKGFYAYSHVYCGGKGKLLESDNWNSVAILGKLSTGEIICQDNH